MSEMERKLVDSFGRQIRDLRISLTDRCNFRCFYCLPHMETSYSERQKLLSFEEIRRVSGILVGLGIRKIRLTGGEPMLRRDIEKLIGEISSLREYGLEDLALTTNGFSIERKASLLSDAGLDRITLSLDSLERENFERITGTDKLREVLCAIAAAKDAGLDPVKINAVIVRGHNENEIAEFARFARDNDVSVRFIEFMPLDSGHDWNMGLVVSGKEIKETVEMSHPLVLKKTDRGTETAWKYSFADGAPGEIGIIAPVTEQFCGECSRIRLTADGQIRTCLFSETEHDLRALVRGGATDSEIIGFVSDVVLKKEAGHRINERDFVQPERTMSFIGG